MSLNKTDILASKSRTWEISDFGRHFQILEALLCLPFQIAGLVFGELKVKVAQSCPTFCDPMYQAVHGIFQARLLEWLAFPFCWDLPNAGMEPRSPTLQENSFPAETEGKPNIHKTTMGFFKRRQDGRLDMAKQINQPDFSLPMDGTRDLDIGRQVFVFFFFPLADQSCLDDLACFQCGRPRLSSWGRFSWRREWLPTAAFLPRESHGQGSQTGSGQTQLSSFQRESQLGKGELFLGDPTFLSQV